MTIPSLGNDSSGRGWRSELRAITPGYFQALRVPVLYGRDILATDQNGTQGIAIVNETFARRFKTPADAVGQEIRVDRSLTIVGVVRDVRQSGLLSAPFSELFLPQTQLFRPTMTVMVRTDRASSTMQAIRKELSNMDSTLPISQINLLTDVVAGTTAKETLNLVLFGIFALLAWMLAALGVYSLMSYIASENRREMAIRLSLGAHPSHLIRAMLRSTLQLAAVGIAIGITAAFLMSGMLRGMLFGVSANDAFTFVLTPLFFTAVALLATLLPGRRATSTDPLVLLRDE